jgi:hypothetical protein
LAVLLEAGLLVILDKFALPTALQSEELLLVDLETECSELDKELLAHTKKAIFNVNRNK